MTNRFTLLSILSVLGLMLGSCGPEGPEFSPVTISGTITCLGGTPLEGVEVTAITDQGIMAAATFTDSEGNYLLDELESGFTYLMQFDYEDNTPLDYEDVEMFKDFLELGGTNLNMFQLLQCDLNNSGIISPNVYVDMINYVDIGYVTGWRFATTDFSFPNPGNPNGSGQADEVLITPFENEVIDLYGLKLGDLNLSSCN